MLNALLDLAARCEAATGPDRELDDAILAAINPAALVGPGLSIPPFSASLDAAMTLVREVVKASRERTGP